MLCDWLEYASKQNMLPKLKDSAYTDEELLHIKKWIVKSYLSSKITAFEEQINDSENMNELMLEAERFVESTYVLGEFTPDTTYINSKFDNGLPSMNEMRRKLELTFGESIDLKTPFPLLNDYLILIKNRYGMASALQTRDATLDFAALMNWMKEHNEQPLVAKKKDLKGISALLLGLVQVGKSTRINALLQIAPSFYDIAIVLTSNNNRLQNQGQKRIEEDITGYNSIKPSETYEIFHVSKKRIEKGGDNVLPRDVIQLITKRTSKNSKGDNLNSLGITPDTHLKKMYILVIKKEKSILSKLYGWIKDQFGEEALEKLSLLIVDDESDYASPHNVKSKEIDEARKISREIRKTMEKLPRNLYIGVTATPWGVFFGSRPTDKETSYPSFIQIISPPVGYLSPYHFFSVKSPGEYKNQAKKLIKHPFVVNTDDPMYPKVNKIKKLINERALGIDTALVNALNYYLLSGAIMTLRGLQDESHVMMIHIDTSIKEHKNLKSTIDAYFDKVLHPILTDSNTKAKYPEFWIYIKELYNEIYIKDKDQIISLYEKELIDGISPKSKIDREIGHSKQALDEDKIPDSICTFFRELRGLDKNTNNPPRPGVYIMNSDKSFNKFELTKGNKAIVVGGFVIGRGLTIEGLRVSYYDRKINIAESGVQHLRFTGYHSNRDLIRVFLNEARIREFEEITSDLFVMEMKLRDCECTDIVNFKLNLPKLGGIKLTSKTINMRVNTPKPFDESREAAAFDMNKDMLLDQKVAAEHLIDNLIRLESLGLIEKSPVSHKNTVYRDVPISLLVNFLTRYPCSNIGGRLTEFDKEKFVESITSLEDEVKTCDVIFVNVVRPYKGIEPRSVKFGSFQNTFGLSRQTLQQIVSEDETTGELSYGYEAPLGRGVSQDDRKVGLTDEEVYFGRKLYIWYNHESLLRRPLSFKDLQDKLMEIKEDFLELKGEDEVNDAFIEVKKMYGITKAQVKEYKKKEAEINGKGKNSPIKKNNLIISEISDDMYRLVRPTARLIIKGFDSDECQIGETFPDIGVLYGFYIFSPIVKNPPVKQAQITQKVPS